jgi:urea transport system permease protein
VLVNYAKTTFTTGLLAPYWLFALGALFVFVTLFLPKGIFGLLSSRLPGFRANNGAPAARAAQPAE